jgi:hypothetical protein
MWIGKKLGDSMNVTKREKKERTVATKAPRNVPLVAVPKLDSSSRKDVLRSKLAPNQGSGNLLDD